MTPTPQLLEHLRQLRRIGMAVAVAGGVLSAWGWVYLPERFYPAWLTSFFYWLGMALGCLVVAMLHGMTGGGWGRAIRRIVEAGYQTIPLFALLFVPISLNAARIYPWADPAVVRHSETLARKVGYLNVFGFQSRAIIYLLIWMAIAWVLTRSSPNDEPQLDSPRAERRQRHSGLCFIAYGFSMTLAAVDWVMSLEPEWYSTMYGLIHMAGQAVSGLSLSLVIVISCRQFEPWPHTIIPERLHDLGNLLLAAVMFWAYCSFFQYLVIWSGNLPEENVWYVHRSRGGWQLLGLGLAGLHFVVPFLLLLSRHLKRDAKELEQLALFILLMRYADLYWLIVPGFEHRQSGVRQISFHWLDVAALAAMGGAWLWMFAWRLSVRVRLPMYDPIPTETVDARSSPAAAV